jgi:hypothetical protein
MTLLIGKERELTPEDRAAGMAAYKTSIAAVKAPGRLVLDLLWAGWVGVEGMLVGMIAVAMLAAPPMRGGASSC